MSKRISIKSEGCRDEKLPPVYNVNQQGNGNTLDWIIDHAVL